jgi:hypothetical protein
MIVPIFNIIYIIRIRMLSGRYKKKRDRDLLRSRRLAHRRQFTAWVGMDIREDASGGLQNCLHRVAIKVL